MSTEQDWTWHDFICMTLGATAYHQGLIVNPRLMLDGIVVCNAIMRERTGDPDWGKLRGSSGLVDYVDLVLLQPRHAGDTLRVDKVRAGAPVAMQFSMGGFGPKKFSSSS